jgi:hypothetical protein
LGHDCCTDSGFDRLADDHNQSVSMPLILICKMPVMDGSPPLSNHCDKAGVPASHHYRECVAVK